MASNLLDLYQLAERKDISVSCFDTLDVKSMSALGQSGSCYVAINPFKLSGTADETVALAHELGHCECGAFYNLYSPYDVRSKHEAKATKWAIKKLIPKEELKTAYKFGTTDNNDLANLFGVTEEFIEKAIKYYFYDEYL